MCIPKRWEGGGFYRWMHNVKMRNEKWEMRNEWSNLFHDSCLEAQIVQFWANSMEIDLWI